MNTSMPGGRTAFFSEVYSILVEKAGALEEERTDFMFHHDREKSPCEEWRFRGKLGFGGKYYSRSNTVSCYSEDLTPDRQKVIAETNEALSGLHH
jgi:hypothetical protein